MKKITTLMTALLVSIGLVGVFALAPAEASMKNQLEKGSKATTAEADRKRTLTGQIRTITNVLLFVIGAIAVIVIIYGGIKFVTSDGDSSKVKGARDTILYAVVGLVVAIIAYAIVAWVIDRLT